MRIRTTTRVGASPHPIPRTTPPQSSVDSGHGWTSALAVLVSGGLATGPFDLSAELAPDTASSSPLAELRHTATTDGGVRS